ncbi:peptidase inhibitor family I36 protein [Streptomyces sp. NPDC004647]|uniref:peptidase inhibitor family I36 protein n=1 Tax=Streptomyces sp. NPDC004647 TaxID=3154671 RepID=UPI0033B20161
MRRFITAVVSLVSAIALTAGLTSTASASPTSAPTARPVGAGQGIDECPQKFYCLYDHRGFNIRHADGQIWIFKSPVTDLGTQGAADRASSVVNNLDEPIYLYRHFPTWSDPGTCLEVPPHRHVYDLGLYTLDNEVSSVALREFPCY